jgi:hypothetical protein
MIPPTPAPRNGDSNNGKNSISGFTIDGSLRC